MTEQKLRECDVCEGYGVVATTRNDMDGFPVEVACPSCNSPIENKLPEEIFVKEFSNGDETVLEAMYIEGNNYQRYVLATVPAVADENTCEAVGNEYCWKHDRAGKECRAQIQSPSPKTGAEKEVVELKAAIAKAAICLLRPNAGITCTIWLDKYQTLYEHLVSYLDVELTGDVDADIKAIAILSGKGGVE